VHDARLGLALAHYREAVSSDSHFYRFLAYWNALDVLFQGNLGGMTSYLDTAPARAPGWFRGLAAPTEGWGHYLRESNRHAIAHAVRHAGKPSRNPDDPTDRLRLNDDSRMLQRIVR
jgi:hypothetical protein